MNTTANPFTAALLLAGAGSALAEVHYVDVNSTNAVWFTMQSTTNLVSPVVGSTNSPAPIAIGGQNVVTNTVSGPQQFFRLVQ